MKRITSRAIICLFLSLMLLLGTCLFVYRFFNESSTWVAYPANKHLYSDGKLTSGRVIDDKGSILAQYRDGWKYSEDDSVRLSTVHAVGDPGGQIGTGSLAVFAGDLTGYNMITGTGGSASAGRDLHLTINSTLSSVAYDAMQDYSGLIAVYDYTTGKILCMVSTPAYDPYNPKDSSSKDGAFINKVISSRFTPGSIFKIITTTAALEKLDLKDWEDYRCSGNVEIGDYKVTCPEPHGTVDLEEALNVSCNCAFGEISVELGSRTLEKYTEKAGLTSSYSINGIKSKPSTFDFSGGKADLAWSGIGQGKDQVNPLSMMIYCGAIGGGGASAYPQIIDHLSFMDGAELDEYTVTYTEDLIDPKTAEILTEYMRTDVERNYGTKNFPGLNICAKSGTAQVDKRKESNGWFAGFLNDTEHPLAFICLVEEGGSGAKSAGKVVNTVLQKAIDLGY